MNATLRDISNSPYLGDTRKRARAPPSAPDAATTPASRVRALLARLAHFERLCALHHREFLTLYPAFDLFHFAYAFLLLERATENCARRRASSPPPLLSAPRDSAPDAANFAQHYFHFKVTNPKRPRAVGGVEAQIYFALSLAFSAMDDAYKYQVQLHRAYLGWRGAGDEADRVRKLIEFQAGKDRLWKQCEYDVYIADSVVQHTVALFRARRAWDAYLSRSPRDALTADYL